MAILTNNVTRCPYYEEESANVKSRWGCIVHDDLISRNLNQRRRAVIPNTEEGCKVSYVNDLLSEHSWQLPLQSINGTWNEIPPNGHPPPQCMETLFSRDNHLGNGIGGFPNTFNWTIPNNPHENCVFRARYIVH